MFPAIPQTVWPHWGVLTAIVKAPCLIEVVSVASGIFPVNFHTKWFLWNVHVHFDCAGISVWHFPFRFPRKMALAKCPWAFRLRRLARNGCRGPHKTRHLTQKSCQEGACTEILPRDFSWDLVQRSWQESSYRDLAIRALVEILYRDLAKRFLIEILSRDPAKRAAILLRDLLQRAWTEILLSDALQKSSVEISYREVPSRVLPIGLL